MSKRARESEGDVWNNYELFWEDRGPDPRIQTWSFRVESTDSDTDPSNPHELLPKDRWTKQFKTLKAAATAYRQRIQRPKTKACEIMLHMKFGGFWERFQTPLRPSFTETYIYLVRWRADGAFLESYHVNESQFAERQQGGATDELQRATAHPGLLSHWIKRAEEEERAKKKAKAGDGE